MPRSHGQPTKQPAIAGRTARKAKARKARLAKQRYRARIAAGLCVTCRQPSPGRQQCVKCLVKLRERSRKPQGLSRRIPGALSYKLQGAAGIRLLKEAAALAAERAARKARERAARAAAFRAARRETLLKLGLITGRTARILDEFTNLPISRQRKYQLRKRKARRCVICGQPAVTSHRCLRHSLYAREWYRKSKGAVVRHTNTRTYRLEDGL